MALKPFYNKKYHLGMTGNEVKAALQGGGETAVETTYSALKTLRDGGNLVPGTLYRITDYVTTINGKYDLSLLGAQGYLHYAKSAGHPFDLCVLAISATELDEHAIATLHSGDTYFADSDLEAWDIKYTIDNDPTQYIWADPTNGKGVIYFMRDEYGNEAGYDFKNAQILAYALAMADPSADPDSLCYDANSQPNRYGSVFGIFTALSTYTQTGTYESPYANSGHDFAVGANILGVITFPEVDATYLNTFQADWYYTFDYFVNNSHNDASLPSSLNASKLIMNNKIALTGDAVFMVLGMSSIPFGLNASIFEFNFTQSNFQCTANELGWGSMANIFGGGTCSENKCGALCYGNIFGENCYSNTFGGNCYSNTFGGNCYSNTFGGNCYSNTFGGNCNSNTFGGNCYSNTFGGNCNSNTFGNGCYSNTFGGICHSNTFGNGCYSNTFGNTCFSNTFGNDCDSNTFGGICTFNTFGNDCYSNTFGNGCYSNTFGNDCDLNTFGNGCESNTFGNNDNTINLQGYDCHNRFGDFCQYIQVPAGDDFSRPIKNYEVKNYVSGTLSTPLSLNVTLGNVFVTCIGYNSQGNIVSWVPAD